MARNIHPSAVVHPDAVIADNVTIGPAAVIEDKVRIGEGTVIDAFAKIMSHTSMGKGNRVHSYSCVGGEPQDLKFHGEPSTLEIGDDNVIREFATLHRGTEGGGMVTRIGNGCLLMAYTHVAHDCILGNGVIMSNAASLAGHVTIHDHAIIGGMSGVHQFVHVGAHSFLGGMSGLAQDLPPYMLAVGNRAVMHGPNAVGLRRLKVSQDTIRALRSAYKRLFRSELPRQEALEEVEYEWGQHPEIKALVDFVRNSERGVTSADKSDEET
ncbi:MAG: acyl-ACP--UDP-N-acetylglucosamine O-acyltransferase [Desulfovibrionaceae bacterium]